MHNVCILIRSTLYAVCVVLKSALLTVAVTPICFREELHDREEKEPERVCAAQPSIHAHAGMRAPAWSCHCSLLTTADCAARCSCSSAKCSPLTPVTNQHMNTLHLPTHTHRRTTVPPSPGESHAQSYCNYWWYALYCCCHTSPHTRVDTAVMQHERCNG